ncbi:hypothetical protein [Limnothrix sp. PR1529]|uniref:hypothetical protein n=1 Tax=Limnothrix sp. PR1529 TaxID=1704291 RepID=UPI0018FEE807|nr:hypothetical protein [Limnothrix sp. PR1529]
MGKRKRIQSPTIPSSPGRGRIAEPSVEKILNYDQTHPIFCLRHLQAEFDLDACDRREQADFAKALWKHSQMTWRDIWAADRHGLGAEKIARESIRAPIPNHITEDVDFFIALRFSGKVPMVGYRIRDVFHVIWLDPKFDLYEHG